MASQKASPKTNAAIRAPQRQRGRERVAALLKAGEEIFAEKGFDAATMTEIAARAKASIGSLYQFFPTKELLADALQTANGEALAEMLEALSRQSKQLTPTELLDGLFQDLSAFFVAHPSFVLLPDHIVICGPGTRAMDLLRPSFEAALESQTIPELRALAAIHVVESSLDLLTEGVVMQALRELDFDLARLKAA